MLFGVIKKDTETKLANLTEFLYFAKQQRCYDASQ